MLKKYQVPLSHADADTIRHACEKVLVSIAIGSRDYGLYGRSIFILTSLLKGEAVEIDDDFLEDSRKVLLDAGWIRTSE